MNGPISKGVSSALPRVFSHPAILKSVEGSGDEVEIFQAFFGRGVRACYNLLG